MAAALFALGVPILYDTLRDSATGREIKVRAGYWRWRPRIDEDSRENNVRYVGGGYCKVQNTALQLLAREDLSKDAWRVLFFLLGRMNKRQKVQCGKVCAVYVAKRLGLQAKSVQNILYRLQKKGLIAYRAGDVYVNPFAFQVGVRHENGLISLFRETLYYEAWTSVLKNGVPGWY